MAFLATTLMLIPKKLPVQYVRLSYFQKSCGLEKGKTIWKQVVKVRTRFHLYEFQFISNNPEARRTTKHQKSPLKDGNDM